jgi:small GTP-binding protein
MVTKIDSISKQQNIELKKIDLYDKWLKISVIGDSGNGKTTLINKFVNGEFFEERCSTIGLDFRTKIIENDNKKIKIKIWDTAGQERFAEIVKSAYRDSDGIILTYDITNYESFLDLDSWMEKIKNVIDNEYCCIILVGTKADLPRKVPQNDVVDFILKNDLRYIEISSKDGTNIDSLFIAITEMILRKIKNKPEKENKILRKKNTQNENFGNYIYNSITSMCIIQ